MYYILSPKPLQEIQKYKIDRIDKYTLNYQDFYNSTEGKEFLSIHPLRIRRISNRNDIIESIISDISWLSICYNIPLYLYVMKDNYFLKNMPFVSTKMFTNFEKISKYQDDRSLTSLRVDKYSTYFFQDMDLCSKAVIEIFKNINLSIKPIRGFKLSPMQGFIDI